MFLRVASYDSKVAVWVRKLHWEIADALDRIRLLGIRLQHVDQKGAFIDTCLDIHASIDHLTRDVAAVLSISEHASKRLGFQPHLSHAVLVGNKNILAVFVADEE